MMMMIYGEVMSLFLHKSDPSPDILIKYLLANGDENKWANVFMNHFTLTT